MKSQALIGRCGLYCGACDIHRAFVDKEKDRQQRMADFFNCRPEQVRCQGCQNLTPQDWCSGCKILSCLEKKKYHYCYECRDIEDCNICQELNRRYNNLPYQGLQELKKLGETKWLERQMARWCCPECGVPLKYDDKKCAECGSDLTKLKN